jgi:hypothetical protein
VPTPEEVSAELEVEERDDYVGSPPVFMFLRAEQVVGYVFLDDAGRWRYDESAALDISPSISTGSLTPRVARIGGRADPWAGRHSCIAVCAMASRAMCLVLCVHNVRSGRKVKFPVCCVDKGRVAMTTRTLQAKDVRVPSSARKAVARHEPVQVVAHSEPQFVLLHVEDFELVAPLLERRRAGRPVPLNDLLTEDDFAFLEEEREEDALSLGTVGMAG